MTATPRAPAGLGKSGRTFWRDFYRALERDEFTIGLDPGELRQLEAACRHLDKITQLEQLLETEGIASTGSTGQRVIHPALAEVRAQQQSFRAAVAAIKLPDDLAAAAAQRAVQRENWRRKGVERRRQPGGAH